MILLPGQDLGVASQWLPTEVAVWQFQHHSSLHQTSSRAPTSTCAIASYSVVYSTCRLDSRLHRYFRRRPLAPTVSSQMLMSTATEGTLMTEFVWGVLSRPPL